VDQYVLYFAPALMGGDDGVPLLRGPGAPSMDQVWRGRISSVRPIGPDVRIDVLAGGEGRAVL
jgi:riboflavin biosynthesis pyrimidine reductase